MFIHLKKRALLVSMLAVLPLLASGCSFNVNTQGATANDVGGVLVSPDKGEHFKQLSALFTGTCPPSSIASANILDFHADPGDSSAVYAATDQGLYYTYNVARGWFKAVNGLPETVINDVAVDAKNKCMIFVASGNKLYRSSDCSRSWSEVYTDNNAGIQVSAVAVDHYDDHNIYLGTSRGDIIKSTDGGSSWRTIQRLDDGVRRIIINPHDSRLIFVASVKSGLFRFNGNSTAANLDDLQDYKNRFDGSNWSDLNSELKEFDLGFNFKDLLIANDNTMFLATDKVLLKSLDNGKGWIKIKLITPEKDANINAVAVNPKNPKEIYYVTNTTFFKSDDGGINWSTKQLVTSRAGSDLLIDFNNPQIIYLGTKVIK